MKWLKKFDNPFVLGLNGFLAGAALFFATHPDAAVSGVGASTHDHPAAQTAEVRQSA
ncbi:hypothetical protein [Allosphingosinicella deserti]|uniref:hypothetical protein n=1 Tax=Allosphingosinicella deserti TaxID=2116704 RepID=UPI001304905C|nr:hypothetical protein [Sphingomonas deserti]